MKILFVCRSNAERSPIAEYLFNSYSKFNTSTSAGTNVDVEGTVGWGIGRITMELLCGLDFLNASKKRRKQLTKAMVKGADLVVVIMDGLSERKQFLPLWLRSSPKIITWDLKSRVDYKNQTYLMHVKRFIEINDLVRQLVKSIG